MTARENIKQAVKDSDTYRYESDGAEGVEHVCCTVDFSDFAYGSLNLTEPKGDVARTVANHGWAVVRTESAMLGADRVRRIWFGDPSELGDN